MIDRSRGTKAYHLRIGTVPYMNAKPLIFGIPRVIPDSQVIEAVPSRLTAKLARRQLDVAILPVMGYFQIPGTVILPDICIASRGPVQSVRLFYRRPINNVRRVHLDTSSMTSAALTKIILAERYGLRPQFVSIRPVTDLRKVDAEALLLIGDPAMQVSARGWQVMDLGAEWDALTGLPFIYALWVAHKSVVSSWLIWAMSTAKKIGQENLALIARSEAQRLNLPYSRCLKYLSKIIFYDLGPAEIAGLKEFRKRAIAHGLIPRTAKLIIAAK